MTVYDSTWYKNELNRQSYQGANSTYYLSWNVYNDDKHLYIDLTTGNRTSIMKIIRTGFTVYVDETGKKSTQRYVQYPVERQKTIERERKGGGQRGRTAGERRSPDIGKMLEKLPQKVKLSTLKGEIQTTTDALEKYTFQLALGDNEQLLYTLAIPLEDILTHSGISEVSIGLVSGHFDIPQRPSSAQGSGGRKGQGGMGAGSPMSAQMAEMADPIKIWFKTTLAEGNE